MEKYFVAPPTLFRWAKDLVAKRGPLAPAIVGAPRFSLAEGERKAGRGKNAECELRLAIKSRSHRHGAGGELKSIPDKLAWGRCKTEMCRTTRNDSESHATLVVDLE